MTATNTIAPLSGCRPTLQVTTKIAIPIDVLTKIRELVSNLGRYSSSELEAYLQLVIDDAYNIGLEEGKKLQRSISNDII